MQARRGDPSTPVKRFGAINCAIVPLCPSGLRQFAARSFATVFFWTAARSNRYQAQVPSFTIRYTRMSDPAKPMEIAKTQVDFRNPMTVPKRFSIGAFLGITTVWSVMVLGLRQLNAPTVLYYFFGIQLFLVCLAQMKFDKTPRWASSVAGSIVMYVVVFISSWIPLEYGAYPTRFFTAGQFVSFWGGGNSLIYLFYRNAGLRVEDIIFSRWGDEAIALFLSLGVGAAYGYALGTFTAGIFLLGGRVSQWFESPTTFSDSPTSAF
jgi:hypothetical protein